MIDGVRVRGSTVELIPHPRYAGDRVNINSRTNRDGTVPSFLWALFPDWPEGVVENVVSHVIALFDHRTTVCHQVPSPLRAYDSLHSPTSRPSDVHGDKGMTNIELAGESG